MEESKKTSESETADTPETEERPETSEETSPVPEEGAPDLKTLLEQKDEELRAAKEKYLRAYAELENYKKRVARDHIEQLRYANEKIFKELLPILDNMDRALTHMKGASEPAPWVEGVELTYKQCLDVLKKFGVTPITSLGELFDPSRHQAVTYFDTQDHPENHVAEELQKGFMYHDRILRPSMVAVARKPAGSSPPDENQEDETDGPRNKTVT